MSLNVRTPTGSPGDPNLSLCAWSHIKIAVKETMGLRVRRGNLVTQWSWQDHWIRIRAATQLPSMKGFRGARGSPCIYSSLILGRLGLSVEVKGTDGSNYRKVGE